MIQRIVPLFVLGAFSVGCQTARLPGEQDEAEPDVTEHVSVQAPIEVRSDYRDPQLAFRGSNAGFRAGHGSHDALVAGGAIEVTPKVGDQRGSPITFETASISRDGILVATDIERTFVNAQGELSIARAEVIELVENRAEGVEQRWVFESAPAGDGELIVSVGVRGQARVESSAHGLHFFPATGPGFRYSHARWLDAAGEAWDLPAVWENDQIVIRVPQQLMDVTVYPAVLDPTIEAEQRVDDPILGNLGQNVTRPYVASRGAGLFAVWSDQRNDTNNGDIYATRLTTAGAVLDTRGVLINAATGAQRTPVAARVGTSYLVAWDNAGDITAASVNDSNVVTQLGNVSATGGVESVPAIAAQGTTAMVAWQVDDDIYASTYTGSFGPTIPVATGAEAQRQPAVAASATGFLVAWSDGIGVKAQLFTSAGVATGAVIAIGNSSGSSAFPAVAFNGTDYMVVFNVGGDLYGARVSTSGVLVDATPVVVSNATGLQQDASLSCSATTCLVTYLDGRNFATGGYDIYGHLSNFDFTPSGTDFAIQTAVRYQVAPSVAVHSAGWFAVWEDLRTGGPSLAIGTPISAAGAVADATGIVVSRTNANEQNAAISNTPTQQFVVWADSRALGNNIVGVRYNGVGGARLDAAALTVSNGAGDQAFPAVVFDGTNYVVVWSDARGATRDIYATAFTTSGTVVTPAGVAVSTATGDQTLPDVAAGGGVALAVWMDRQGGTFDIYGAILSGGALQAGPFVISAAASDQDTPAVAFDPNSGNFVVVWSDKRGPGTGGDIRAARVTTAGAVLDANSVLISGAQNGQISPDIAVSGTVVMAVWDDRRSDSNGDIFGARINTSGTLAVLDAGGIPINYIPAGQKRAPSLIGLPGERFFVAWQDTRNNATLGSDIYGQELRTNGTPLDTTGFVISNGTASESSPAFQNEANTGDRVALVYHAYRADLSTTRAFRRVINFTPQGGTTGTVCTSNGQCGSGFCVDGYCCNEACGGSSNFTDCQTCAIARGGTINGTCTVVVTPAICRNFADYECDSRELCDGVNRQCPVDLGRNAGLACTKDSDSTAGTCSATSPYTCL